MSSDSGDGKKKCCCGSCCGFIVTTVLFILLYWAIFQPHQIRATVDSAALSNLTVSTAPAAVSYRLAVNLSLYNPSKRVSIYYDTFHTELRLFRDDGVVIAQDPTSASPTEFHQRKKAGDVVRLEFDGRDVGVPGDVAGELEKEVKGEAQAVSLVMDVYVRVRYVFWLIKIRQKPRVRCWVSVPVKAESPRGAGVGGAVSSGDRCRVKY